ncbi:hypothetical protein LMG27177_07334 [Paraburkholderia fynbosensis]|uniref:Uncharacterized protein n=1 Tax=Paraburkholderia fynbosensis TaxID=1200993 RepID=A0A6J5H2T5_9BURK|nr:hypothetical protein LMG27177_07334 [Paraburkholderia fynbosensis]
MAVSSGDPATDLAFHDQEARLASHKLRRDGADEKSFVEASASLTDHQWTMGGQVWSITGAVCALPSSSVYEL